MPVLLGVDAGGTSTRALACDEAGAVLGRSQAGGANLRSSLGEPEANLRAAIAGCLQGRAPDAVCVGLAGVQARRDEAVALVERACATAGVTARPMVVTDLEIAFRSVSSSPRGRLLLAGTGAIAAAFDDWQPVARRDGLGWLLGDTGSGVWLGRRVLRAVAADLDGAVPTAMTPAVLAHLGVTAGDVGDAGDAGLGGAERVDPQRLVAATDGLPPAAWAQLAPVALAWAGRDEVATALVEGCGRGLLATLRALPGARADPVVLAGGLLAAGPLRARIESAVRVGGFAAEPVRGATRAAAAAVGIDLPV